MERDIPAAAPTRLLALDGLRALAVASVIVYHADHRLLPGGFVGVDLFFVLSGYLITTLLLVEHDHHRTISLRQFWGRRVRRLWPLAWVTLTLIAFASLAGAWGADRQRTVPAELVSAFAHVANWYEIGHGGYVRSFAAPSPMRHYWSLAIEEQFYLVWPILLTALLAWKRRAQRAVPTFLGLAIIASIVAGLLTAGSPDRAYLGSDVRAVALAIGALLAWVLRQRPWQAPARRAGVVAATIWGGLGAALLVTTAIVVHADDSLLARGGFTAIAISAAGVIVAAIASPVVSQVLSWRPLVYVGHRSFALYLVHWPLIVALGPGRSTFVRLLVAGPVALAIAALLHAFVERPVMVRRPALRWLSGGTVGLVALSTVALVVSVPEGRTPTERVAESLGTVPDPTTTTHASTTTSTTTPGATTSVPGGAADATSTTAPCGGVTTTTAPATTTVERHGGFDPATVDEIADPDGTRCDGQVTLLVVGDSTGRGAANGLVKIDDPRLVVWDRTQLGCSFGGEKCPDWRQQWGVSVAGIDPDVVLVYDGVVDDFRDVDDAPFMSAEATTQRIEQLTDATELLSSAGARVYFVTPAVPLPPKGLYYCDGDRTNSRCDPDWVARWNEDVLTAARESGAGVLDVGGWITERGSTQEDRPDGLHLAGAALLEHARWLAPQLEALG